MESDASTLSVCDCLLHWEFLLRGLSKQTTDPAAAARLVSMADRANQLVAVLKGCP